MNNKNIIIIAVLAAAALLTYFIVVSPTTEDKPGTTGAGGATGGLAGAGAGGAAGSGVGSTLNSLLNNILGLGGGTMPSPNSGLAAAVGLKPAMGPQGGYLGGTFIDPALGNVQIIYTTSDGGTALGLMLSGDKFIKAGSAEYIAILQRSKAAKMIERV